MRAGIGMGAFRLVPPATVLSAGSLQPGRKFKELILSCMHLQLKAPFMLCVIGLHLVTCTQTPLSCWKGPGQSLLCSPAFAACPTSMCIARQGQTPQQLLLAVSPSWCSCRWPTCKRRAPMALIAQEGTIVALAALVAQESFGGAKGHWCHSRAVVAFVAQESIGRTGGGTTVAMVAFVAQESSGGAGGHWRALVSQQGSGGIGGAGEHWSHRRGHYSGTGGICSTGELWWRRRALVSQQGSGGIGGTGELWWRRRGHYSGTGGAGGHWWHSRVVVALVAQESSGCAGGHWGHRRGH
eukprot:1159473-Pelagomonas_calceolata.AAC.5